MFGCVGMDGGPEAQPDLKTGEVQASLRLADDSEILSVDYLVTSDAGYSRSGRVSVADSTLLRFRLGGLPISDSPYHMLLTATSLHGATCGGEADFVVRGSTVTRVSVLVECVTEDTQGDVTIDGTLQSCPLVTSLEVIPAEVRVGASTQLAARISHGSSPVRWSGGGGVFSAPGSYRTSYRCEQPGVHTLTASVDQTGCADRASVEVLCTNGPSSGPSPQSGLDARPSNRSCVANAAGGQLPLRLSETGCFEASNPSEPVLSMLPFDVNAPLWSDGATKRRWFALPDGAELEIGEDGDLLFPEGAVLAKEFRLDGRLLETRLLMYQSVGVDTAGMPLPAGWLGVAYRWNEAQTDATLVTDELDNTIDLDGAGPLAEVWRIPTRNECRSCHTAVAGFTLGPELAQLNREQTYPSTGRTANQLVTLGSIGILPSSLTAAPDEWPRLADYRVSDDPGFDLDDRARAYLHANCSMCHRKPSAGGTASPAPEDFRATLPLRDIHACGETPRTAAAIGLRMNLSRARILAPGSPEDSVMYRRMTSRPNLQMPPLGTQRVDPLGSELIANWIRSINQCPP